VAVRLDILRLAEVRDKDAKRVSFVFQKIALFVEFVPDLWFSRAVLPFLDKDLAPVGVGRIFEVEYGASS
jgi:hypothetical protein